MEKNKNLNFRLLKQLYLIHSPSNGEEAMIRFLLKYLKSLPNVKYGRDSFGNVWAVKGKAKTYPCICGHLDQVQREYPQDLKIIETRDLLTGFSPSLHSFISTGHDDKNGVFIALEALRIYPKMKIYLFRAEEVGAVGASHADIKFFDDVRWVVECDRRGNSDIVTNISFTDLCSDKFIEDIEPEKYGFKPTSGMLTDLFELKTTLNLKVSCVNLSVGYYNPHSPCEELSIKVDIYKTWGIVKHIIEDLTDVYPHEVPPQDFYGYGMQRWDLEEDIYIQLQEDPNITPSDLIEYYKDYFPELTLDFYRQIVTDYRIMISGQYDSEDDYCETINQNENEETIENNKPKRAQKKSPF